ncbi:hypothetical protein RUM44_006219 [Polyplax serrata]|uniref:AAA+ ATPase domain-containing protein n=1 Tax=Polyplax serrata TaxID=468196 RepID=A0ABR1AHH8_POLSC
MLSFQNLHQLVFNLSQATSAVTSGSVRFSSPNVKRKTDIDVACNESFLRSFNVFKGSDNIKYFDSLPKSRFGPNLQDIQWIFFNDVNSMLTSKHSVKRDILFTSSDTKILASFSGGNRSGKISSKGEISVQKLRCEIPGQHIWNNSFISSRNFDENKASAWVSKPGTVNCRLLENMKLLNRSSGNIFEIQTRGFKTKRLIEAEENANRGFIPHFRKIKKSIEQRTATENMSALLKSNKYREFMTDETLSEKEKLKLKVSFAEGYMVAANELKNSGGTVQSKVYVALKNIFFLVMIAFAMGFFSLGGRKIFPFSFGHHGEIVPEEIGVTFADVKGVEEVKEELQEIVEFLRNPSKFSSMGGKLPRGVLLVGPPGTGKTLLARAVAGEANVPFFHVSGSEFDEIFVGEGARRVRNLFRSAKSKAPAIIFIDEIDCVGSKRKTTMLHPYANQTINQLLSEMDGFTKNEGIIVLGATNRKDDLDSALLRPGRFDVEVSVPLPDLNGRKQILELYISKILSKGIDVEKIAKSTAGCTGADLEAIINHAAIRAASEGASFVTMEHVENAKDKILIGPEKKSSVRNEEADLITAYHEGGHTVVAYFSEGAGVVDKVTIVPRGQSLGHTAVVREDDRYITKAMCLARMDIALGGRAAEELIYGVNKITANAADDLDKATDMATRMVKNFGMSEKVGLRTLRNTETELVAVNQYGQLVSDQVDTEVKRLVQESYERAKTILKKHAKEHKLLAEALVKYKTLSPEDVRAILGEKSNEKSASLSTGSPN